VREELKSALKKVLSEKKPREPVGRLPGLGVLQGEK